ncbi:hypothetical protein K491DRAFT_685500 [Lophiostoma macrostomum CBS 122681]|uniref:Uncharacterized protein n=1 Tax=Lophiostoma macrostomum CBS 122681 TaxID=1314788 RepID=A0A6A6SIR6_9PLEO|nr:hypothetical protein K491DRAFT_685500 [Lophiostoma macrostomum CBS 122681]
MAIPTSNPTQIMVQVSQLLQIQQHEHRHFLISLESIELDTTGYPSGLTEEHSDVADKAIVALVLDASPRVPLSFLSRGRFIFLDEEYWVCTRRLPTSMAVGRRRSAASNTSASFVDFKRHYSLPADWISSENAALCCMMSDGTLLYPRNGEVAVVQSESLRPGSI